MLKSCFCVAAILSVLLLAGISGYSQQFATPSSSSIFDLARPSLTRFTNTDGLPVNGVTAIERDSRGFIWFGTQDGGAVFNGHEFKVVNMPDRIISNSIRDIFISGDDTVWFATDGGGVHALKGGDWVTYNKKSGLGSDQTRAVLETIENDRSKILWVGRRDGLSRFAGGKWENFDDKTGLPDKRVRSLLEVVGDDGKSAVWVGTYGGVVVWNGKEKKVYNNENGLPGKVIFDMMQVNDESGGKTIWVATEKGPASFKNGKWTSYSEVSPALSGAARSLGATQRVDGTTTLWFGLDPGGLAFLEKGKWRFVTDKEGLPNTSVFAISETGTKDGSIWMANLGAGVTRLERSGWRTIDDSNGLENTIVFGVSESVDSSGIRSHWVATYGGGLSRFSSDGVRTFTQSNGLPSDFVQALYTKKDGDFERLYVGTEKGFGFMNNGRFKSIVMPEGNGRNEIWKITEATGEGEKGFWVGTNGGLVWVSPDHDVTRIDPSMEVVSVRDVLETKNPNGGVDLWVGSYQKGLLHRSNGKWRSYTTVDGLPTNRVYSVAEIKSGDSHQIWAATGGGIAFMDLEKDDGKFEAVSSEASSILPSDRTYKVFQDRKDRIYVTTNRGVARIVPNSSGDVRSYASYIFTTKDGLPNDECVSGASYVDSKGMVWIGTVGGAAVLDVENEYDDTDAEPLFLEQVLIGGESRDLSKNPVIDYEDNEVVFEYVMPAGFRESATRYRTQLVGLDDTPTAWTTEHRREFSYIPGGDFVFKVWAMDAAGNQSGPLEVEFRVLAPWWQRWWAILLFVLAVALVVGTIAYMVSRYRYKRMLEIERVRTRIATDLHDDVGASLSKISILSEVLAHGENDFEEEDRKSLFSIAETSRDVVGSMSDMVWAINPQRDNFRDAVQRMRGFAGEVFNAKGIDYEFDVPEDEKAFPLGVDLRRQLYLVFKESVNNAAKHSGCEKVKIELKRENGELFLRVADNGTGFESNGDGSGNGLRNMTSRAEAVGGSLDIDSKPGEGTTVTLRMPGG
ncbi:MAG: hypothetical protein HKN33_18905 [Pyrinomonadaceae bacterium]|nr:hypothetical protein [Pyrinomonadaceae bacterium]